MKQQKVMRVAESLHVRFSRRNWFVSMDALIFMAKVCIREREEKKS